MEKNLYLKIDDDVTRAVNKISKERASEITLILPKESWLLANLANLKMLKKQADALGKSISILTNDRDGQHLAHQVGFELKDMSVLKRGGASMDVITRKPRQPAWQALYPKKEVEKENPAGLVAAASTRTRAAMDSQRMAQRPVQRPAERPAPMPVFEPEPTVPAPEPVSVPIPVVEPMYDPTPVSVAAPAPMIPMPEVHLQMDQPRYEPRLIPKRPPFEPVSDTYELKKPSYKKGLVFLFISIIIAALVLGLVVLPRADVIVYAHTQPVSRTLEINLDPTATQPDSKNLVLPAKVLSSNQQISQQFTSTGIQNVGIKATGSVQIYNFTGKTLKLGAGTTKLTVGDKVYDLLKDATGIKPTKKFSNGTDVDPSSLSPEVAIVADQAGDDYNFPGGTRLEINNSVLGPIPTQLYAESTQPIAGGVTRYQNVVAQTDLDQASKQLQTAALAALKQQAQQQDSDTILDAGTSIQVASTTFDKKAGDSAQNFNGTIVATVKGLEFNNQDLQNMVRDRIDMTLDAGTSLASGSQETFSSTLKASDLNLGTGILDVTYQGVIVSAVDPNAVQSDIRGKSPSEVKEILLSEPNIDGVDLTLKPFWVTKVPSLFGNVDVKTEVK